MDLDQLLAALCSPQQDVRVPAEATLKNHTSNPQFALQLLAVALDQSGTRPMQIRQISSIVLKQTIRKKWHDMGPEHQAALRQGLLPGVAEPERLVRKTVHVCIALVAHLGSVADWPELFVALGQGLGADATTVLYTVECLAAVVEEAGHDLAVSVLGLQETLLALVAHQGSTPEVRRRVLMLYKATVSALIAVGMEEYKTMLPRWLVVFAACCSNLQMDEEAVKSALAALRVLNTLCTSPTPTPEVQEAAENVLSSVCAFLHRAAPEYEAAVLNSLDAPEEDDEEGGFQSLVMQVCEFISTVACSNKLRGMLKDRVLSVLRLVSQFMRISESQAVAWETDPNEYLACDDDDHISLSVRVCGEHLLEAAMSSRPGETKKAVLQLSGELIQQGETSEAAWKYVEVGFLLFGLVSHSLPNPKSAKDKGGEVAAILTKAAAAVQSANPLLRSRALWLMSRSQEAICKAFPNDARLILQTAAQLLGPGRPEYLRLSAARVLARFLPDLAKKDLQLPHLILIQNGALEGLGDLLMCSCDEALHLILEVLTICVKHCGSVVAQVQANFCQAVTTHCLAAGKDPLVHTQFLDLLSCALAQQGLKEGMQQSLLPRIAQCLASPDVEPHEVGAAVDIYVMIVRKSGRPIPAHLWTAVGPMLHLVQTTEDNGVLQNCTEAICVLIRHGQDHIKTHNQLGSFLAAFEKLLGPEVSDSGSTFVGAAITQLISAFSAEMSQDLTTGLMRAMLTKLYAASRPGLRQSLVLVFARLMHTGVPGVLNALQGITIPIEGKAVGGLEVLLSVWFSQWEKIGINRYSRNVSLSGLCLLLQCPDPRIDQAAMATPPRVRLLEIMMLAFKAEIARVAKSNEATRKLQEAEESEDDDSPDDGDAGAPDAMRDLVDALDTDDDDSEDEGDDIFREVEKADPIYQLNVLNLLVEQAKAIAASPLGASLSPQAQGALAQCVEEASALVQAN
mmetsp:Transcript_13901/g.33574  ORF Transcript_13901/g.33574 Transcript_13901/m.33574 type:complete len:966 (-) Transcript_13901:63-2960(-)